VGWGHGGGVSVVAFGMYEVGWMEVGVLVLDEKMELG
jgi:hypothetical protein